MTRFRTNVCRLLAAIFAAGCQAPGGDGSGEKHAGLSTDTCAEARIRSVTRVVDFQGNTQVWEHAGVNSVAGTLVLAGVEVDAADSARSDAASRVAVVHARNGTLPPPPKPSALPMALPIPVALSDKNWGILWAEAAPVGTFLGKWLPTQFTQLWLSEWSSDGWRTPRKILETSWRISWETNRTVLPGPGSESFVAVVGEQSILNRDVMFGRASAPLQRIDLPSYFTPQAVAFVVNDSGAIELALHVTARRMPSVSGPLFLLKSIDGGKTWTKPHPLWQPTSAQTQIMRMHYDRQGTLHILMQANDDQITHIYRSKAGESWQVQRVPPTTTPLIKWVAGITQCGRLAIMRNVVGTADRDFEIMEWRDQQWSASTSAFPGYLGVYMFDGVTGDGTWYVGWSGSAAPRVAKTPLKVWLAKP